MRETKDRWQGRREGVAWTSLVTEKGSGSPSIGVVRKVLLCSSFHPSKFSWYFTSEKLGQDRSNPFTSLCQAKVSRENYSARTVQMVDVGGIWVSGFFFPRPPTPQALRPLPPTTLILLSISAPLARLGTLNWESRCAGPSPEGRQGRGRGRLGPQSQDCCN